MKFGKLRSGSIPRVRAGSMRGFVKPVSAQDDAPEPEVRLGEKYIKHSRPAFDLNELTYYCLAQYLDENDDCIFELILADRPAPVRIRLFHIDHHLNVYWYDGDLKVYFGKLGGHYSKECKETGIYFTSTDFMFTDDELKNLSKLFAERKNFYDIEEDFIVTIMDNYTRFTKHKELSTSIVKQIQTKVINDF